MLTYKTDDFINPTSEPAEVVADKKISLLYDLHILKGRLSKNGKKLTKDSRESALRDVLSRYCTETQIDNALHDVVYGRKTLNQFLAQKECEHND